MGTVKWNGHSFAMDLHAEWAIFFEHLNIRWEYQVKGLSIPYCGYIMPTFWLPSFDTHRGTYVIVKFGGMFGPDDIDTCFKLCQYTGANVMMAESSPDSCVYEYFYIDEINCEPKLTVGIPNADQAWGEDRMFTCPGYENADGRVTGDNLSLLGEGFLAALEASKSIQFEGKLQFA